MAAESRPLWQVLSEDLEAAGISKRRFARMLADETAPAPTFNSWHRAVKRATKEGSEATLSVENAELFARLLGQPADRYVRRQKRMTVREERDALRETVARLQEELRQLHAEKEEGA